MWLSRCGGEAALLFDLVLVSVYLQSGTSIQSPVNIEVLNHLLAFLKNLADVWLLLGDHWRNSNPRTLLTRSGVASKDRHCPLPGRSPFWILAFFMVVCIFSLSWIGNVPFRPHAQVKTFYPRLEVSRAHSSLTCILRISCLTWGMRGFVVFAGKSSMSEQPKPKNLVAQCNSKSRSRTTKALDVSHLLAPKETGRRSCQDRPL